MSPRLRWRPGLPAKVEISALHAFLICIQLLQLQFLVQQVVFLRGAFL
jgi:hypothetical protein